MLDITDVQSIHDIDLAMIHNHINNERRKLDKIFDKLEGSIATNNANQLSMDKKIDLLFDKLDHNTKVSETALGLAQKIDGFVETLNKKTDNHETQLKDHDIRKAKIEGGMKVLMFLSGVAWLCISAFYYMYIKQMHQEIGDETMLRIQNSNIKVDEVKPNSGIYKLQIFEQKK